MPPEASQSEVLLLVAATLAVPVVIHLGVARPRGWSRYSVMASFICASAAVGLVFSWRAPALGAAYVSSMKWLAVPLELLGITLALRAAVQARRAYRLGRPGDFYERLRVAMREGFGESRLADVLAMETAVLVYAFSFRAPLTEPPPGVHRFGYHEEGAYRLVFPALAVALVLETLFVHHLVSPHSALWAWGLTSMSAYGLLWLLGDFRAMRRRPLELSDGELVIRSGLRWDARVRLQDVRRVLRTCRPARDAPGYWQAFALGVPQLVLELERPLNVEGAYGRRKRDIHRIGVAVDDVAALEQALRERCACTWEEAPLRHGGDAFERLVETLGRSTGKPLLAGMLARELALVSYSLVLGQRRAGADGAFFVTTTHKKIGYGVVLVTLLVLAAAEMVGAHLLLMLWSASWAWGVTLLNVYGLLWLFGDFQALRLRPLQLKGEELFLRVGLRVSVNVQLANVAAVRPWAGGIIGRPPDYLRATPMGTPRLLLELREPVPYQPPSGRTQWISRIGLTVDDEPGFLAQLGVQATTSPRC